MAAGHAFGADATLMVCYAVDEEDVAKARHEEEPFGNLDTPLVLPYRHARHRILRPADQEHHESGGRVIRVRSESIARTVRRALWVGPACWILAAFGIFAVLVWWEILPVEQSASEENQKIKVRSL